MPIPTKSPVFSHNFKTGLNLRLIILKNSNNSTQLPKLMYFLFFPQNQKHMSKISLYSHHLDENVTSLTKTEINIIKRTINASFINDTLTYIDYVLPVHFNQEDFRF